MLFTRLTTLVSRVLQETWALGHIARAGGLHPMPLRQLGAMSQAMRDYGPVGAAVSVAALRHGTRTALIDELGTVTYSDLDTRSNAVANAWRKQGLRAGDTVAILARNHRGLLEALFGAAKSGARIVLLNTDFGAVQIREVLGREGADLLVHDAEYGDAVAALDLRLGCVLSWTDQVHDSSLDSLIGGTDSSPPPAPAQRATVVILTSGTTGTPKGASRTEPRSLLPAGGLLSRAPFRARQVTECCVPLFHALGFGHVMLGLLLGSTLVVRRRFDPQRTLDSLAVNRASALIAVPTMLRRMVDLDAGGWAGKDLSALRIIFVAGSQLGATLCTRAVEAFGPVVYNMYGSTEVAYATIATPSDLAVEPGCVGRAVPGAVVKIFDEHGRECPTGTAGRIFVANGIQFDGYTTGGSKESIDGMMASGDVGHLDKAGRLFIDGRDDDMIVSGAENVFPGEVEEALATHPQILEAAVLGVADDEYGQRLCSYVALRPNETLSEADIKHYVSQRLARFKVPRDVIFVDALPRNSTGKVLKRLLNNGSQEASQRRD